MRDRALRFDRFGDRSGTARSYLAASLIAILGLCVASEPARSAEPATRPSTPPATRPANPAEAPPAAAHPMVKWWSDLADRDAGVREQARINLLSMKPADLPAFRRLVEETRPLLPSQAVVLRDVVTQLYLAGRPYDSSNRDGFLGVRLGEVNMSFRPPAAGAGAAAAGQPFPGDLLPFDPEAVYGVVIMERMPGFAGARMLQDGDVILALVERPNVQLRGPTEFSLAVRSMGAGQTIHFQILRQGQVIKVPVVLDPRPDAADFVPGGPTPMQGLLDEREKAAQEYWDKEFAPLVREEVG